MPTFNVLDRSLFIRAAAYGTAFALDWEERQYLITARHLLVDPTVEQQGLKVYRHNRWQDLPCRLVGVGSGDVDVAVLAGTERFGEGLPLPAAIGEFTLSQDVFFVGYPYKLFMDGGSFLNGKPMPFIKKGTLSAFEHSSPSKTIYLDAINNEGFSGGPIVFSKGDPRDMRVMGVVSKFRIEVEQVHDSDGDPTGHTVFYNTGILVGYGMQPVLDIINRNPAGFLIK
jgi:hypothetical protein